MGATEKECFGVRPDDRECNGVVSPRSGNNGNFNEKGIKEGQA